jgi:hypothetical protein
MPKIADINDNELWITETTLMERYGKKKDVQVVDTDIRLYSSDRELTECPAMYWQDNDCHFIVVKAGEKRYCAQFFYRGHEQYGTGVDEYDDLAQCVVSILQIQTDHERAAQESMES